MKGLLRIFRMVCAGLLRVFCRPWFWLAIAGVGLIDALSIFGQEEIYDFVLVKGYRDMRLPYAVSRYLEDRGYLWYGALCLTAFPVAASYIEDVRNNREAVLFTRLSCFSYAMAQSLAVMLGSALCLFLGDFLFLSVEDLLVGMEISGNATVDSDILLKTGNAAGYLFFWELQRCMRIAFFALLTFLASLWVKEKQFLTVIPMIFCYIFTYFIVPEYGSILRWVTPRMIYYYNYGLFFNNCVLQGLYAVGYTIAAALLAGIILWRVLLRRRRV